MTDAGGTNISVGRLQQPGATDLLGVTLGLARVRVDIRCGGLRGNLGIAVVQRPAKVARLTAAPAFSDAGLTLKRHYYAMELSEAIGQRIPLQVLIPNPRHPLQTIAHCAAEVFLVDTEHGRAVVWLDAHWCAQSQNRVCHIAYGTPNRYGTSERWIDQEPRYGPRCLAYQKPLILERLSRNSPVWREYTEWLAWRGIKGQECDRRAAWLRVEQELSGIVTKCLT